jgi:nitroimidazol reductase NimA-like FMN-containing flavoprotein (pyridoxamine 5'-phosphate oxidase superfamily)
MWIDERGSEVLDLAECRHLLALGAAEGRHGHLAFSGAGAPVVQPADYAVHGHDVVLRVGDTLSARLDGQPVAFQVDGATVAGIADHDRGAGRRWSVLVRGLAVEEDGGSMGANVPAPEVAQPGRRIIRIRADVVTGRRLEPASEENPI